MNSGNDWIDSLFADNDGLVPKQEMESLLTGELHPDERLPIIKRILADKNSVQTFADIWDDLRPDYSGLDARVTLGNLLQLAEARLSGPESLRRLASGRGSPEWLVTEANVYRNAMLAGAVIPSKEEDSWLAAALGRTAAFALSSWEKLVASKGPVRGGQPRFALTNLRATVGTPDYVQGAELRIPVVGVVDNNGRYSAGLEDVSQATSVDFKMQEDYLGVTIRYRGERSITEAVLVVTVRDRDGGQTFSAVTCFDRVATSEWYGIIPAEATSLLGALQTVSISVVVKE